ncbi:hypothetical protein LXA43DRAFT_976721 [Ganoderma leucocontextum]|nr:hypothetical protein LXA43DRAFT_976721 [Ganoderma leucocontextum]
MSKSKQRSQKKMELLDDDPGNALPEDAAVPFEGNYYGDYDPADFDDYDEYDAADDTGNGHSVGRMDGEDDNGDIEMDEPDDDDGVGLGLGDEKDEGEGEVDEEDEEDKEDEFADAEYFDEEGAWEPPPPVQGIDLAANLDDHEDPHATNTHAARQRAQEHLHLKMFTMRFPGQYAGASQHQRESMDYEVYKHSADADSDGNNLYHPWKSRLDWELGKWAKMCSPGSTAVTELLGIEELVELLGLSFKNTHELDAIVNKELTSGRPCFIRREIKVAGELFKVFYRNVIQCVHALFGDPEFAGILIFTPERHYTDADHTVHVYFDMHTGRWWWDTQKEVKKCKPGATIIPVIISSDKTQLTIFGSKTAYPVYLTIGNLPKDVRHKPSHRGQILLAYLLASRLQHITNKAAQRQVLSNLFHKCMSTILKHLIKAGIHGIKIKSGNGAQLLVTCCKNGTCPKCAIVSNEMGNSTDSDRPLRDLNEVLMALAEVGNSATVVSHACREAGIKPVQHPFWEGLPYIDIFRSITPSILHQLHQGIIRHLLSWLKMAYSADELDACCRCLPPNHQLHICHFILGLVVGLPLLGGFSPVHLICAVRAILDFLYLAQYPAHTSDTLTLVCGALERFHANKAIFVDLGIRQHFHFPKLYSLDHYLISIKLFGTTDNYDTQYTERLHIDFTKDAYRATNHKDKFPQMTLWLERHEKILRHDTYIQWRFKSSSEPASHSSTPSSPSITPPPDPSPASPVSTHAVPASGRLTMTQITIAKWPTVKALQLDAAANLYSAPFLRDVLARFIVKYRAPYLSSHQVEEAASNFIFRFAAVPVFHKVKFILEDTQRLGIMESMRDTAHARPERQDKRKRKVPVQIDTVLVNEEDGGPVGVHGYHVGHVQLIFKLPMHVTQDLLPDVIAPGHLAYVEWYTVFTNPDPVNGMYKVSRCRNDDRDLLADIIEVRTIRRSCHLLPVCCGSIPRARTSSTALDTCEDFWFNPFRDMHMYMTLV